MKTSLTYLLVLTISFFLLACTKQVVTPTPAEVTASQLQQVISSNNIKRVIDWDYGNVFPNSFSSIDGTSFSFSNGFLITNDGGFNFCYNLNNLRQYNIANVYIRNSYGNITGTDRALILYFK